MGKRAKLYKTGGVCVFASSRSARSTLIVITHKVILLRCKRVNVPI